MEKEKITKKKLITYLTILIAVLILGTVTATYAFFQATTDSETIAKTTIIGKTDCIKIEFSTEENRLGLDLDYAISDEYAMQKIQPVIVSIHNTCEAGQDAINYTLTLSTFAKSNESYMKDSQIRTHIDSANPYGEETSYQTLIETKYLDELNRTSSDEGYNNKLLTDHFKELSITNPDKFSDFDYSSYDTITNYVIDTSSVTSLSTNKYKIYLWVDYYEGDKNAYNPGTVHNEEYDNTTMNHNFESLVSLIVNNSEEGVEPPVLAAEKLKDKVGQNGLIQTSNDTDLTYRYVGNEVNNYICFGTTDKTQCKASNGDNNYMYRIIGVDKNNRLKLIKNKELDAYAWHSNMAEDAVWDKSNDKISSEIYTSLNGSTFLNSSTYIPSGWEFIIDRTIWNIGDVEGNSYVESGEQVYNQEKLTTSTTPTEIGLMYLSDYYYAYDDGTGTTDCYSDDCTSWLTDIINESWTMTRYGNTHNDNYYAWFVNYDGYVEFDTIDYEYTVRPVFYLTSGSKISSGIGTLSNPFILSLD